MRKLWRRHPRVVSLLLGAATVIGLLSASNNSSLLRTSDGSSTYTAVVTAAAALAALGVVPISIVLGLSSPRVKSLTREKSRDLRRTVAAAVSWHLLTIALCVVAIALDSELDPHVVLRALAIACLMVGVESTLRAVVEFLALLRLEADTVQVIGAKAPLPPNWLDDHSETAMKPPEQT